MDRRKREGHAFLSYVREDARRVDRLQHVLEKAGIPVWRDTASLWPGDDWRAEVRRAIIDYALVFIACFSHVSLSRQRSYQNEELVLAIEQLRLRRPDDSWLIPVRLDECVIPDWDIGGGRTLASIQCADVFGDRLVEKTDRLVEAVQRILWRREKPASGRRLNLDWVEDPTMAQLSQLSSSAEMMRRFDRHGGPEWYRGRASAIVAILNAARGANIDQFMNIIEIVDDSIEVPPYPDERIGGAKFSCMNAYNYARYARDHPGTEPREIVVTLEDELACIARCFELNRQGRAD